MRQNLGKTSAKLLDAATVANALPVGDVGVTLASFADGAMHVRKWLVTVKCVGTGTFDVALWGRTRLSGGALWGAHCRPGSPPDGKLTAAVMTGVADPGKSWHFTVEDLGVYASVYGQILNVTGTVAVDMTVSEILHNSADRGD